MISRVARKNIIENLSRQAAVAIIGPRQVGKTTLALEIGSERGAIYLDLESSEDRDRLESPALFLEANKNRLVILDEIHRMPALFESLRGIIDRGRREGLGKGRFLILGSASIELLRQSGESLAGRITYIDLGPLSVWEVADEAEQRERLWLRGGFPDSFLAETDHDSFALRKDFIRTYLERDVAMFGPRIPTTTLERLWTMLAHRQAGILNASEIGRALEISTQTVGRYIDLLSDLLLVRRLTPFHANIEKRLVKSPKVYIRDSGLLHALLGIETAFGLSGHPVVGNSWEGFVIENIVSALPWRATPHFYRTAGGAEIDLVIQFVNGDTWAIEIKRSRSAKPRRGYHEACRDISPTRCFVVHAGDDRFPLSESIEGIGLREIMGMLGGLKDDNRSNNS